MTFLASLCLLLASPDDGTLVTADGVTLSAQGLSLALEGTDLVLTCTVTGSGPRKFKAADIVELTLGTNRLSNPAPADAKDVEITLTTGDLLTGRVGAKSEEGLQLVSKIYGNPLVKFDQIRSIVFPANARFLPRQLPETVEVSDFIYTSTGDRRVGTLLTLSDETGVTYHSKIQDKEDSLGLRQVAGIWMSASPPPKEPAGLFSTVLTADRSSVRGEIQTFKEGVLVLKDLYGATHRIAGDSVAGIYMKNGRVVYLSDLDPMKVEENANFIAGAKKSPSDLEYPFKRDRSARGTSLVLGGTEHRKGLGVRAHSSLTFALDNGFKRFQSTFGLDKTSNELGAVTAEVWVDARQLKSVTLKGRDGPQTLDLDVSGGKELRLVVTWAGNGQSDFADWASARLIR